MIFDFHFVEEPYCKDYGNLIGKDFVLKCAAQVVLTNFSQTYD